VCVAEVAVPARLAGVVASPQSTAIVETVPSESDVENVRVTDCPVSAGFGDELVMLTVGDLSFTVTEDEADPVEPPLSVAVITIVNDCDLVLPVFWKANDRTVAPGNRKRRNCSIGISRGKTHRYRCSCKDWIW
jgi:hypothetical protein